MRRFTGSGVSRSLGRLRLGPRVTVVVWVPERAVFLDECLAGVRASTGVRTEVLQVPESGSLDQVVASAGGEYVAFLSADDLVLPQGLGLLAHALAGGADVAVGRRTCRRAGRPMPVPPAGAPTDLTLGGKLFRLASWRAAGIRIGEWDGQARAVNAALTAATGVVLVPEQVVAEHERDTGAPIHEQRRYRADRARTRFAALRDVLSTADRAWRVDAVAHLLPSACRDAVAGRAAYFAALQPFAREVVDGLPDGCADETPVAARLVARSAAHGTLDDVCLILDHLADNPHGLPVTGGLADLPAGLEVPTDWRRIGLADRRLRSRILDPVGSPDAGRVLLRGNAFVTHDETPWLPQVFLDGTPIEVRSWPDPTADAWAERAWEDRGECGFEAVLASGDVPAGTDWAVRVVLGGLEAVHRVRLRPLPRYDVLDEVDLGPGGLRVSGTGRPVRLRLAGAQDTSGWAAVSIDGDRFEAVLPLAVDLLGGPRLLSGGRYRLDAEGARGRPVSLAWSPTLLSPPPDLTDDRLGLHVVEDGLVVGPPLTAREASPFVQQQRVTAYAGSCRAESPRMVLLESFHGRVAADNPAAIGRELAGRDDLDLDLVWVVDDPGVTVPTGTRAAPRRTQAWFDALAGAHAYVGNAAAPPWFHKSDHQVHLQTWHGTPLKKIGEDRGPGDFNTWRHRRQLAGQAARWDAFISPSPYCSEIFRSAFRYDGPMLEIGYPRNDVLLSERAPRVRAETRQRLGLTDADRVLLYAPTWREYVGVRTSKPLFLDPARVVAAMPDAVVLVRGHYNATRQPDVFQDRSRIIDVTRYPDIADLYLAADCLVTDYSSVMFDFALTDKPMVLLTPDLDQYRDVERGFYFDIEAAAPGPMVATTDEVLERLAGADEHAAGRARFRERFSPWDDGHAAERAVDHLLGSW